MSELRPRQLRLLRELVSSGDTFCSGEKMARRLEVSRVSVSNDVKQLRELGFEIEAVRNRGYRLLSGPSLLQAELLEGLLHRAGYRLPIHVLASVDSTNSEVSRLLADGSPAPFVVLAHAQEAGRGRRGRAWKSDEAGNLYLSLGLRPSLPPSRLSLFTLYMGLRLCLWLRERYGLNCQLKWPNDLYVEGRKLAGMLTESRLEAELTHELIFGLGLNVNSKPSLWEGPLEGVATSLSEALERELDLNEFCSELLLCLLDAWEAFLSEDYRDFLFRHWPELDLLEGQPIRLRSGEQQWVGVARGLDEEGGLQLESEDGQKRSFSAGDVSLEREALA